MKILPLVEWDRCETAAFFGGLEVPFYSLSWRVDVTQLYGSAKRAGRSFYLSMIYEVMASLNATEAFLYKLRGDTVVRHDRLSPSFTVPHMGDRFKIVSVELQENEGIDAFCARAGQQANMQTHAFPSPEQERRDDWAYLSCLPWIDILSVTNETGLDRDDSVPRVSWGKYVREGDRLRMTVALQVNHRLIDGVHIGHFAELLQSRLDRA